MQINTRNTGNNNDDNIMESKGCTTKFDNYICI